MRDSYVHPVLVRAKMAKEGIGISSGIAMRKPNKGLGEAWELALLEMYNDKRRKHEVVA